MIRIFITTSILLTLIVNFSFGQNDWEPGYIIKNEGDTVYGFIDNRDSKSNSKRCCFRTEENGKTQVFSPDELIGYRLINSKFFVSKSLKDQGFEDPVFLEFLINGKVKVYHFKDESDQYFVEKDSVIYELKNTKNFKVIDNKDYLVEKKEYVGMLNYVLEGANLQAEINNSTLSSKSLIKVAKKYHNKVCTDEECIIYEKNIKPIHFNMGLHGGIQNNNISFGGKIISNSKNEDIFGCRFEFENVFAWQERISFILDFNFQKLTNYELKPVEDVTSKILYDDVTYYLTENIQYGHLCTNELAVNMDALMVKIPFTLNYAFSLNHFRPYFGVSFINMFTLSQNKDLIIKDFYEVYDRTIPLYHFGALGKVGSKFVIYNKQSIYLELSYEYISTMNVNKVLRMTNYGYSVAIGYSFGI